MFLTVGQYLKHKGSQSQRVSFNLSLGSPCLKIGACLPACLPIWLADGSDSLHDDGGQLELIQSCNTAHQKAGQVCKTLE